MICKVQVLGMLYCKLFVLLWDLARLSMGRFSNCFKKKGYWYSNFVILLEFDFYPKFALPKSRKLTQNRLQLFFIFLPKLESLLMVKSIDVARVFDLGGPKPQITCNDVIRNFLKRNFLWGKDIVKSKI